MNRSVQQSWNEMKCYSGLLSVAFFLIPFRSKKIKKTLQDLERFKLKYSTLQFSPSYGNFEKSYSKVFNLNIFDIVIPPDLISPNDLHDRFSGQSNITILNTRVCEKIDQFIKLQIANKMSRTVITGPIGIGKSFALLAQVLNLRKRGEIVFYINNPDKWKEGPEISSYFIKELIYAAIPLANYLKCPEELINIFTEKNNLFK